MDSADKRGQDAQALWEHAAALSNHFFSEKNKKDAAVSYLSQLKSFYFNNNDYENGVMCLRALAEHGEDSDSQRQLGTLYREGCGVKKNELAALYWFNKAEEQGDTKAGADCEAVFQTFYNHCSREDFAGKIGILAHWCRTGMGPVPLDRERGAYWTGRMEKALTVSEKRQAADKNK